MYYDVVSLFHHDLMVHRRLFVEYSNNIKASESVELGILLLLWMRTAGFRGRHDSYLMQVMVWLIYYLFQMKLVYVADWFKVYFAETPLLVFI
jgi:hypothetical protein